MKILAITFGLLFAVGIVELGIALTLRSADRGRAEAALGAGLVGVAILGGAIQLAVHAFDVWLRRRRR